MMNLLTYLLSLQLFKSTVESLSSNKPGEYQNKTRFWDPIHRDTSDEQFVAEMTKIANHASSLRDGNPWSRFVNYTAGYNGIVGRLCFEDDLCWATKIVTERRLLFGWNEARGSVVGGNRSLLPQPPSTESLWLFN